MKHKIFKGLLTFLLLILTCSILTFLGWMFIYHAITTLTIICSFFILRFIIHLVKYTYKMVSRIYDQYKSNK